MAKLGKKYEQVVTDVMRQMDAGATVTPGTWVSGPDGMREIDVLVAGNVNGSPFRIQIECKDYDSAKRKVGIAVIDAVESKHRDLGVDLSFICSNAGFSSDAMSKARRVGIGLIGVLKSGDGRIKYGIHEEIYIRRIDLGNGRKADIDVASTPPLTHSYAFEDLRFQGNRVLSWLQHRVILFIANNMVVNGRFALNFRFRPFIALYPGASFTITGLSIRFQIEGNWVMQRLEIDAKSGVYDWLRKRIRHTPGDGSLTIKDVKCGTGGKIVRTHPELELLPAKDLQPGEVSVQLLDTGGFAMPEEYPPLDQFLFVEDADPVKADLPPEVFVSATRAT